MHFLIPRFLNLKYFTEERYKYLMFSSRIPAPICNKKKGSSQSFKKFRFRAGLASKPIGETRLQI